ncbi:MAG: alpha-galactosidase, partial [Prolixibacteraceae bacterium]|nr:alpha-galactosidase [Prolixibacteraceae bacterium]
HGRDEKGVLLADPVKFPNGIKAVADYVHSKGLKFGIYTSPGVKTCAGFTGSQGYEETDLKTFAEWGVDFIKLDNCGCNEDKEVILRRWRGLLDKIGRPILLSVNLGQNYAMIRNYANMWRTSGDIMAVWNYPPNNAHRFSSIYDNIESQSGLESFQAPGLWNDPDMLQVGNGQLSEEENRAHFSMWAMFSAPMIAGNDLRNMKKEVRDILTNREVIALGQDSLGYQGRIIVETDSIQIWVKRLHQPTTGAVALLNQSAKTARVEFKFSDLGLLKPVSVRDLWKQKDMGRFRKSFTTEVPGHGVVLLKLSAQERFNPEISFPEISSEGTTIEAESCHRTTKFFTIERDYNGYTGSGYALGHAISNGSRFTWIFPVARAGRYRVGIRYSLGNSKPIPAAIRVNGIDIQSVTFPSTGGWDKWETLFVEVNLDNRINHITFSAGYDELSVVALDHLQVMPVE